MDLLPRSLIPAWVTPARAARGTLARAAICANPDLSVPQFPLGRIQKSGLTALDSALRVNEWVSLKDEKRKRRWCVNIIKKEKWHQSGLGERLEPGWRDGVGH